MIEREEHGVGFAATVARSPISIKRLEFQIPTILPSRFAVVSVVFLFPLSIPLTRTVFAFRTDSARPFAVDVCVKRINRLDISADCTGLRFDHVALSLLVAFYSATSIQVFQQFTGFAGGLSTTRAYQLSQRVINAEFGNCHVRFLRLGNLEPSTFSTLRG